MPTLMRAAASRAVSAVAISLRARRNCSPVATGLRPPRRPRPTTRGLRLQQNQNARICHEHDHRVRPAFPQPRDKWP
ncbi:MAG: hypothetical protein M0Z28_26515, partial [Rhodospirillales bacterium]|nr:hypothetical protein [Rhodospirillales bacterium]